MYHDSAYNTDSLVPLSTVFQEHDIISPSSGWASECLETSQSRVPGTRYHQSLIRMGNKAQRRGSDYRRKRKRFHNNQYTRKVSDKLDVDCISASAKKLCKESDLDKAVRNSNQSNGYRVINIDILLSELSQYVTCPNCNTKAVLKENILYG
ncbi:hypothetical protein TNCT_200691 [Trichonephila clavata]|uniref:Uncharacterized protein n=1 Tax=Trichonephila clavata TaxID=2740835 RepID=A0A8X6H2Q7_TRICU|nr:hypothetical protein TNCT_200691 [Trichonephila clavata]